MKIMSETDLKIKILVNGVKFTERVLILAKELNAKPQNKVYNMPSGSLETRPQELIITGYDGYSTVVSCVAPCKEDPILIDCDDNNRIIAFEKGVIIKNVKIDFVRTPKYYLQRINDNKTLVSKYVSACGLDELNILPWKGCAISKGCLFCGVNDIAMKNDLMTFNAFNCQNWEIIKDTYLCCLKSAIKIAINDNCYLEHAHVIIISGNLPNNSLDLETKIYSEISNAILPIVKCKATDGIVAVMSPPNDLSLLTLLHRSGISKVVFNLEVANEPWFSKYCPGKSEIGYNHFMKALIEAIHIFGVKNVWTNFVLGLEPIDKLLNKCMELASYGIVPSANILHMDEGNRVDCCVPSYSDAIYFFVELNRIYRKYYMKPFYCQKSLRTSLTNEVFANRVIE